MDVVLEKRDDRLRECIILVARHHVRGASDVDELRAGDLGEELRHPLLGHHITELAPHEERGTWIFRRAAWKRASKLPWSLGASMVEEPGFQCQYQRPSRF